MDLSDAIETAHAVASKGLAEAKDTFTMMPTVDRVRLADAALRLYQSTTPPENPQPQRKGFGFRGSLVVIEEPSESGTRWLLSFDGPSPTADRCVRLPDRDEAFRLKAILRGEHAPAEGRATVGGTEITGRRLADERDLAEQNAASLLRRIDEANNLRASAYASGVKDGRASETRAVEAEREACAKVAETEGKLYTTDDGPFDGLGIVNVTANVAAVIRART